VPVWHEQTKQLVASEKLVVLGIVQEQHADRCRLFAQWKGLEWPILHDPLNLAGVDVVPVFVAVDEHGIVRDCRPRLDTFVESFVSQEFPAPEKASPIRIDELPEPRITRRYAGEARDPEHWLAHGDALVLSGLPPHIEEAIKAYGQVVELDARNADAFFRLGVTHRIRYDRPERQPGDFQAAIDAWQEALRLRPNNYIFRRRLQQYGPRLDKPYPFYDWVEVARKDIAARGETPVELGCEPVGSEVAQPARKFKPSSKKGPKGDPAGKIRGDRKGLIEVTQAVVRGTDKDNRQIVQVHLALRPNARLEAHWNNEAEPLRLWIKRPKTGKLGRRFVEYANPPQALSTEERALSFEVRLPSRQRGSLTIKAYALYNVCAGREGKCQYLRQDIKVKIKL
jgi:tetratricopeptide (TPR) repeat protein